MHSEYVILIAFPGDSVCTNVPHCYNIHTLALLFLKPFKSASVQSEKVFFRNSPCVKGFTTLFIHGDAKREIFGQFVIHNTMFIISFHFLLRVSAFFPPLIRYKCKAIPVQTCYRPRGFQEVQAARLLYSRHIKVVRLPSLCTACLYPPEDISGTHFF
jgi:hypothetical protein